MNTTHSMNWHIDDGWQPAAAVIMSHVTSLHRRLAWMLVTFGWLGCGGDGPVVPPNPPDPPPVVSVVVAPDTATLVSIGETIQLTASALDANDDVVSDQSFSWSSSDESIATVSPMGVVTAVTNGVATIEASVGSVSGTATVTVQQLVAALSITPDSSTLTSAGATAQLTAQATDANGNPVTGSLTWTSSANAVATVDSVGLVTSAANGTTIITATVHGVSATSVVVVSIPVPGTVSQVTAGARHSCALTDGGVAHCWGDNGFGQVGDGSTTRSLVPVPVQGGLIFDSISAGSSHTCAVTPIGDGQCWGNSDRGQVGDGGLGRRVAPVLVAGGYKFSFIEAGRAHTCGLTTSNAVLCWGWGGNGELGNGGTANRSVPDSVWGDHRYTTVRGWAHTHCAVRTTGETDCWGRNNTGQVGDGTTSGLGVRNTPTMVSTSVSFVTVSSGARIINGFGGGTSCGVTAAGEGYCWGQNSSGQIGDDTRTQRLIPAPVSGGHTWKMIDVGSASTCGVRTDGAGYCWGFNGTGVLGDSTTIARQVPTPVAGGLTFSLIDVGFDHACGVTTDGNTYCWGANPNGELGNGTNTRSTVPVLVTIP